MANPMKREAAGLQPQQSVTLANRAGDDVSAAGEERAVSEAEESLHLVTSRCPAKWLAVDLENGTVWGFNGGTFRTSRPAGLTELHDAQEIVEAAIRERCAEVEAEQEAGA